MQGIRNIILGLILAAVSGAIIAAADLGGSYLAYAVWFLLACGVILVAGGLYQSVTPGSDGINAEELYKSDAIAKLMLQSTLSTALADGELNDNEITAIVAACESVAKIGWSGPAVTHSSKLLRKRSVMACPSPSAASSTAVNGASSTSIVPRSAGVSSQ